jgi:hypothetical protein
MSGINSALRLQTVLPTTSSVAATVGNSTYGNVSYSGSGITIQTAADIASPAENEWTNIISITSTKGRLSFAAVGTSNPEVHQAIAVVVDTAEDASEAIRLQIKRDGVVSADFTVTRAGSTQSGSVDIPYVTASSTPGLPLVMEFEESLVVRACKYGTFSNAGTTLKVGAAFLETLE